MSSVVHYCRKECGLPLKNLYKESSGVDLPLGKVRHHLKQHTWLRVSRAVWQTLATQFGFGLDWIGGIVQMAGFASEYRRYRRLNGGSAFSLSAKDLYPCLRDRTETTPVELTYFLQDSWFARKMREQCPSSHVDVGSSARAMTLIAQFVPITFIDIRPVELELDGFTFMSGSVLRLPFADRSLRSISSLCVIEHVGLGRYGDEVDPFGSEKAVAELCRVLSPGGNLYVSVPVDQDCRIYFNAHRAFSRDYVIQLFPNLTLVEERYIYGRSLSACYDPRRGFGTGLYHWRRE
jgi:Caenorhabditis protein of unknown function, DUF268